MGESILDRACFKCKHTNIPASSPPCLTCDDKEFHGNFEPKVKV
jgi:hypothetical protein